MFSHDTPEVLVVGAGPVGLFSALALTKKKVRTAIIDTGVWPCTHSYALALHPHSLKLLREFGLSELLLETSYPITTLGLFDTESRRAQIRLDADSENACLAVTRQDRFEEILEHALLNEGVKVAWRHEASEFAPHKDHVSVAVNEFEKESRGYIIAHSEWVVARKREWDVAFVVGADGYNSKVRRAAGLDFPEVGQAQYFSVFEFETDANLDHEMRIVLGENTTDVLWPLPDGFCRWSFELPGYHDVASEQLSAMLSRSVAGTTPTERVKERAFLEHGREMPELTSGSLHQLLKQRAPWFKGSIGRIEWKSVVRFERRLAPAFGKDRLWLAGDAAHLTGPVGIQSMNLGLAEAHDLTGAIARVVRGGAPLSEVHSYGARWHSTWRTLHGIDGGLHPGEGADAWLGRRAAALTACMPGFGDTLNNLAGQINLALARSVAAG